MSPFEFVKSLTSHKIPWASFTPAERKSFSPYMTNRILSMNPEWIELVNHVQKHSKLPPEQLYSIYFSILPKGNYFSQYLKASKKDARQDLHAIISKHYSVSQREAIQYCSILSPDAISNILSAYGYNEKEIKKLMK